MQTVKENSKVDIKKESKNEGIPKQLNDEKIKIHEISLKTDANTSNGEFQTVEEKPKVDSKKEPVNKGCLKQLDDERKKVLEIPL